MLALELVGDGGVPLLAVVLIAGSLPACPQFLAGPLVEIVDAGNHPGGVIVGQLGLPLRLGIVLGAVGLPAHIPIDCLLVCRHAWPLKQKTPAGRQSPNWGTVWSLARYVVLQGPQSGPRSRPTLWQACLFRRHAILDQLFRVHDLALWRHAQENLTRMLVRFRPFLPRLDARVNLLRDRVTHVCLPAAQGPPPAAAAPPTPPPRWPHGAWLSRTLPRRNSATLPLCAGLR